MDEEEDPSTLLDALNIKKPTAIFSLVYSESIIKASSSIDILLSVLALFTGSSLILTHSAKFITIFSCLIVSSMTLLGIWIRSHKLLLIVTGFQLASMAAYFIFSLLLEIMMTDDQACTVLQSILQWDKLELEQCVQNKPLIITLLSFNIVSQALGQVCSGCVWRVLHPITTVDYLLFICVVVGIYDSTKH